MTKVTCIVWACVALVSAACADVVETDATAADTEALSASAEAAAGAAALALPGATASDAEDALLESCYGSAQQISGNLVPGGGTWIWPASGTKRTTSKCRDINVRFQRRTSVSACILTSSDSQCNAYREVDGSEWAVIASNVADGTRFYLAFKSAAIGEAAF